MQEKDWVSIIKVPGDLEAELIKGLLEAQEIPVVLFGEGAGRAIGLTVGPLGEVELLVPRRYQGLAESILRQYEDGSLADQGGEEP